MKHGITLAALCLLGAMVFSPSARAYDYFFSDDTAAVNAAGALGGSVGFAYINASKGWDADGKSVDYADDLTFLHIPLRVNYGLTDKVTVFGLISALDKRDQGSAGESGLGDIWIGAKYALLPALTLRGALDLPVGDGKKDLGMSGGFGIDVAAMHSCQIDKIGLNGQLGVRWNAEDGDTKIQPGIGAYVDAEGVYSFTEALDGRAGFELSTVADGKNDGKDAKDSGYTYLDLRVGGAYHLNQKLTFGANLYYTVTGTNAYQGLSLLANLSCAVR